MITYRTIPPQPDLAPYVRYCWVLQGTASPAQPYVHRSMADGSAELLFHYQGVFKELPGQQAPSGTFLSGIAGPSRIARRFSTSEHFGIFGVYLYPFALPLLLGIPASTLCNELVDLHDLIGAAAQTLEDALMQATSHDERARLVAAFLRQRLARHAKQPPAGITATIRQIIHSGGGITVEELARRNFLSDRQFQRQFAQYSGFSPKLFSRIIRFQAALAQYGNSTMSLTEIAYLCGYYDQPHFIHDFKEFSGCHPSAYFGGKTEATVWKDA